MWLKVYAPPASQVSGLHHEAESRRLKLELARMIEERDRLKKGHYRADPQLIAVQSMRRNFAQDVK